MPTVPLVATKADRGLSPTTAAEQTPLRTPVSLAAVRPIFNGLAPLRPSRSDTGREGEGVKNCLPDRAESTELAGEPVDRAESTELAGEPANAESSAVVGDVQ